MALFGKKKEDISMVNNGPQSGVPTDMVLQMRGQNLSNNQIIQSLQREGYSTSQIFDAMNQADIKGTVESFPPEQINKGEESYSQSAESFDQNQEMQYPQYQEQPLQAMPPMPPPPQSGEFINQSSGMNRESTEEIVESIVDEKWNELMKGLDKVLEWKESTDARMIRIENEIKSLKERFEELHQGILAKIGEYDKGIRDVGSDIKAMESVFKKILPTFTENVSELSRITKKIKTK